MIKKTVFISDTHGFRKTWNELFFQIGLMDLDGNWINEEEVRLIFNGDNVDRGEDSKGNFNDIRKRKNTIRLMGNHDFAYCGGPKFYGLEKEVWDFSETIKQDALNGKIKFAHRFEENDGTEWLVCHAGLVAKFEDYHNMDLQSVVDEINQMGLEVVQEGKFYPEVCGIGPARGGRDNVSGVTWADYYYELIPYEDKLVHKQIVGHSIQPTGINLSAGRKVWAINVPYNNAQALIYDHELGRWSTSDKLVRNY